MGRVPKKEGGLDINPNEIIDLVLGLMNNPIVKQLVDSAREILKLPKGDSKNIYS